MKYVKTEISKRSAKVTFHKLYKKMDHKNKEFSGGGKRAGNDTLDAYSRLLERLSCFARAYSIEYRLFSQEDRFEDINSTGLGLAVDELIGADDVTVFALVLNRLLQTLFLESSLQVFTNLPRDLKGDT